MTRYTLLPPGNGRWASENLVLCDCFSSSSSGGIQLVFTVAETCFSLIPVCALIRLKCMRLNPDIPLLCCVQYHPQMCLVWWCTWFSTPAKVEASSGWMVCVSGHSGYWTESPWSRSHFPHFEGLGNIINSSILKAEWLTILDLCFPIGGEPTSTNQDGFCLLDGTALLGTGLAWRPG